MRVTFSNLIASRRFFFLTLWIMTIILLSLAPEAPAPDAQLFGFDKLLHATAYATLTLLAGWAFSGMTSLSSRSWLLIAASSVLLGGMLEIAQALLTATRTAEPGDFIANCFGAGVALLAARIAEFSRKARQVRVKAPEKK